MTRTSSNISGPLGAAPAGDRPTSVASITLSQPAARSSARWLWAGSLMALLPVAGVGAVLSFRTLYRGAEPIFGSLAVGYPLLVDLLILGSTLAYIAGAMTGRPLSGWRWTAHGGVVATLMFNAMTARAPAGILWHIAPPAVWAVLVEMAAHQVAGVRSSHGARECIPVRLWLAHPVEVAQVSLHMARGGTSSYGGADTELVLRRAAFQVLSGCLPGRRNRPTRRLVRSQLRHGALDPRAALDLASRLDAQPAGRAASRVIFEVLLAAPARGAVPGAEQPAEPTGIAAVSGRPTRRTGGSGTSGAQESERRSERPSKGTSHRAPGSGPEPATAPGDEPHPRLAPGRRDHDVLPHARGGREGEESGSLRSRPALATRAHVVATILKEQPDITSDDLARTLAVHGWPISLRTARRLLAGGPEWIAAWRAGDLSTPRVRGRDDLPFSR